jgi:hypothetical protein
MEDFHKMLDSAKKIDVDLYNTIFQQAVQKPNIRQVYTSKCRKKEPWLVLLEVVDLSGVSSESISAFEVTYFRGKK